MIRVFPKRTKWTPLDDLVFVGDPPMEFLRPPEQSVNVSVTFTWDIIEGLRLKNEWAQYYKNVQLGGPAFGDPGGEFVPGRFIKKGVTITSRGCPKKCQWCHVPKRENAIRELKINDGNILACSDNHIKKVFNMLERQNRMITFSGGLDPTLFNETHRRLIDKIKIKELWFSCDSQKAIKPLIEIAEMLRDISIEKKRCFVLMGFDGESIVDAQHRVEKVYEIGFLPFAQLYRGNNEIHYSKEWKRLSRKYARPAAYRQKTPLIERR